MPLVTENSLQREAVATNLCFGW